MTASFKYRATDIPGIDVLNLSTPLNGQFELTPYCNYRCQMCYNIWKTDEQNSALSSLTKDQHFYIIDALAPYLFSIILSGGEPTLVPWLPDLITYTVKHNIDVSLITNAALVTKTLAKRLSDSGVSSIQISWHHFNPQINDQITITKGSYQKTFSGAINLLNAFGENKINVNMVANSKTVQDVYSMGKFLYSQGFKNFSVGVLSCSGQAKTNGLNLSMQDLARIIDQLAALQKECNLKVGLTGGMPFCAVPNEIDQNVKICNVCDAALHQIVIGYDGNCRPCVESPWSGGNILTDDISDIWFSAVFEDIRMFRNVPPSCHPCKYVSTCHGGCRASAYNHTGLKTGLDPLMPSEIPNDFILSTSQH